MASDWYHILKVNYLQKVCYILLGDIPEFKVVAITNEIDSYFERHHVDIFTEHLPVAFGAYHLWLQLLTLEHVIEIDSSHDEDSDEARLSAIKYHASSMKHTLDIEPNATIRTYTCDTPETIFNEWFGVNQSDKRKENEMSYNPVSSALSKIRIRINELKRLKNSRSAIECDMITHQKAIDKLTYQLNEIKEDIIHTQNHIDILRKEAVEEGYEEWFIDRIIKEGMSCKSSI